MLQVRATRHRGIRMRCRLGRDCIDQVGDELGNGPPVIEQVEADKGGDLVVAAATGPQLAAELWAGDVNQAAFERPVYVFVGLALGERAV